MKIGCTIAPQEIDLAAECGFDYVEFAGKVIALMEEEEFLQVRRALERAQIACRGFNAYCPRDLVIAGLGADSNLARHYAMKLLLRAQALGVHKVGIGSPLSRMLPPGYPADRAHRELVAFFRATGEVFNRAAIEVCVEALGPCYCNCINRLSEAVDIARAVRQANVGVVVDFYNMEHAGEADREFSHEEIAWIRHVHISDDDGSPQTRSFLKSDKARLHRARIQRLVETGYAGDITLEIDVPLSRDRARCSLSILGEDVSADKRGGN